MQREAEFTLGLGCVREALCHKVALIGLASHTLISLCARFTWPVVRPPGYCAGSLSTCTRRGAAAGRRLLLDPGLHIQQARGAHGLQLLLRPIHWRSQGRSRARTSQGPLSLASRAPQRGRSGRQARFLARRCCSLPFQAEHAPRYCCFLKARSCP
jgi:hypothetical protein